jgi:hypothetical protein
MTVYMIGFVDDSNNCVNYFLASEPSIPDLLSRAQQDAQLWNDLLYCSGGGLQVRKCILYLAHYGFTPKGTAVLQYLIKNNSSTGDNQEKLEGLFL